MKMVLYKILELIKLGGIWLKAWGMLDDFFRKQFIILQNKKTKKTRLTTKNFFYFFKRLKK